MSESKAQSPPEEVMALVGSFMDYACKTGWITLTLMIDRDGKYYPIVASNFDSTSEEKKRVLGMWIEAIDNAEDKDLFLKKEIRIQ
jgi:hypothetical protein